MINDNLLTKVATDLAVTTYYMAYSTDTTITADSGATALEGEVGSRKSCSNTRVDNVLTLNAQRLTTDVVATGGDTLTMIAIFDAATGGNLEQMFAVPNLLHTTSYDLDVDVVLTTSRR